VQRLGSVKSRVSISRQPRRGLPCKAKHQAKLYNTATYRRSERVAVILHPLLRVVTWNIKFKKASDLPHEVAAQICQVALRRNSMRLGLSGRYCLMYFRQLCPAFCTAHLKYDDRPIGAMAGVHWLSTEGTEQSCHGVQKAE
jgi:hypothetical protein